MNKQGKVYEVENLKAKINDAKLMALADFRGLNVAQATQLRNKVIKAGGELQVIKNRLFTRALRAVGIKIKDADLSGTTIVLFANQDEIAPLRAFSEFSRSTNLLPFKIGFMDKLTLSIEELNRFSLLPTREQLQNKLVGLLVSPPYRLVYGLKYNLNKLALALKAIKDQKGQTVASL